MSDEHDRVKAFTDFRQRTAVLFIAVVMGQVILISEQVK